VADQNTTPPDSDNVARATAALLDQTTAETLAGLFKALADPTRVRMIAALAAAELNVSDLTALLGMEQSAVSHQLSALRRRRLVKRRRRGRQMYYSLDDDHVHDLLSRGLAHVRHEDET
jgi:DNA-binding transcriptional ArsR family regulator